MNLDDAALDRKVAAFCAKFGEVVRLVKIVGFYSSFDRFFQIFDRNSL